MGNTLHVFKRRGSAGKPVVLYRKVPSADRRVRVVELSGSDLYLDLVSTDDTGLWSKTAPVFQTVSIDSGNKWLDINEGAAEVNVEVETGTYTSGAQLAFKIQEALNEASTTNYTVSFNAATGIFTLVSSGSTFSILWKTGVHGSDNTDTHIGSVIGFADAANDTGALSYSSDSVVGLVPSWSHPMVTPLVVETGVNDALDFDEGGVEINATVAAGTYSTVEAAMAAVQVAIDGETPAGAIVVSYREDLQKIVITTDGTLTLLWATGTNTATSIGADLGFVVSADDTGATRYQADNRLPGSFVAVTGGSITDFDLVPSGKILKVRGSGKFELAILEADSNIGDASEEL